MYIKHFVCLCAGEPPKLRLLNLEIVVWGEFTPHTNLEPWYDTKCIYKEKIYICSYMCINMCIYMYTYIYTEIEKRYRSCLFL